MCIRDRLFEASNEVFRIFGYDDVSKKDESFVLAALQHIHDETSTNGEFKKDIEIERPDGTTRFVFVQCINNRNEINEVGYHGIIQDITERKIAEKEITKSRERYQEIFTQSKDALFICTLDGEMVDFNQTTLDLFGYQKEELAGIENMHSFYEPVERKNEFLLKLKNQKSVKDFPIKIINKKGEQRECMINANFIASDQFVGYNCMLRDVTELKQAEEIKKARDLAKESAQMKEQFVASISHEMRTPMNAVLGMSNLLMQMDLEGESLNLVKSIKNSSEILLGVVNDILEVSEIQNGKVVFENKPFELKDLMDNLVNVMQYKAQEKDLYLEVLMDEGLPAYIAVSYTHLTLPTIHLV